MTWTPEIGLVLLLLIPAFGCVGILMSGKSPNIRDGVNLIMGATLLANVIALVIAVGQGARPTWLLVDIGGGLELSFTLEPLGALFAALASGLFLLNTIYGIGYMRGTKAKDQTRFFAFFAVAIAATMGVAASGNMLTLFIFYEILTLSTFPLVTHNGDEKARRGGRIYLGILMATSIGLLLPAVIITQVFAGSTDFVAGGLFGGNLSDVLIGVLLVLYTFGIAKAALIPVHMWLPNAMVAPTPVSAFLHAVAVVKAGVFTMVKIVIYLFGIDVVRESAVSNWLAILAAIAIVVGSIIAMTKDNLKARLAWSTIGQLSYVTLGVMIATPLAILGAALQIVMHAFGKITLFMCAGAIYSANKTVNISKMGGMAKTMPWVFVAFFVGSLSIIGLPPFAGIWPKLLLFMGMTEPGDRWLVIALILSSLLNIVYLLPVSVNAFLKKPDVEPDVDAVLTKPPILTVVPPVLTAISVLVLFFMAEPIMEYLRPIFEGGS
ncbi:MAG: monovalent cation/H+ antiporter subunit D family protein [Robiginitomaculum sp.]|nr:monovalent cation/H+ antiporter subunit D family protein [Robiginitomaculum sp.]